MKTREVRNAIPPEPPLRVLIFGAGVLGSLYGARLAEAGNDVAVLARGRRLEELRARGVVLEDVRSGARTATPVRIVSELAPDDPYDVVVVLVRKTQLASVLPPLAASRATPNVLVMVSNPSGPGELIAALGRERLLLGFAGAGGTLDQGVVRYAMAPRLFSRPRSANSTAASRHDCDASLQPFATPGCRRASNRTSTPGSRPTRRG